MTESTVSVIMPVYNGVMTIERALRSVLLQQLTSFELIIVDDGSTDGTFELLQAWGKSDSRIHILQNSENLGPSAARNIGLRAAKGKMVAYLDSDDEFYPDYLGHVEYYGSKGDVLVFGYDAVDDRRDPFTPIVTWDPTHFRQLLFMRNFATPLGVAHRLNLCDSGFHEDLWHLEDWELWKRLARTGAHFLFLPLRSGRYHIRHGSLTRAPRFTARQRSAYILQHEANEPLYGSSARSGRREIRRILYASPTCLLDDSSETFANAGILQSLANQGFTCQAYCWGKAGLDKSLGDLEIPHKSSLSSLGPFTAEIVYALLGRVPVTFIQNSPSLSRCDRQARSNAFLMFFEQLLKAFDPDVLLTDGDSPLTDHLISLAKQRDIIVTFGLHINNYQRPVLFRNVDYCLTSTVFTRSHYWTRLGLNCQLLPCPVDPLRILASSRTTQHVTLADPGTPGGLYFLARLAQQLNERRPDLPILFVGDPANVPWREVGLKPHQVSILDITERNHTQPRDFLCTTKTLLAPSLDQDRLHPVVIAAMANGIPVLASDRGVLPELVDNPDVIIRIPERLRPDSLSVPSAEEVEDWVTHTSRMWDDSVYYESIRGRALATAQRWHPDYAGAKLAEFFRRLCPQPGPPILPYPISG
jgi:glycosyltransferase involved in cell wall biosynthesis